MLQTLQTSIGTQLTNVSWYRPDKHHLVQSWQMSIGTELTNVNCYRPDKRKLLQTRQTPICTELIKVNCYRHGKRRLIQTWQTLIGTDLANVNWYRADKRQLLQTWQRQLLQTSQTSIDTKLTNVNCYRADKRQLLLCGWLRGLVKENVLSQHTLRQNRENKVNPWLLLWQNNSMATCTNPGVCITSFSVYAQLKTIVPNQGLLFNSTSNKAMFLYVYKRAKKNRNRLFFVSIDVT